MFVWKAISSITPMMSLILRLDWVMPSIVRTTSVTTSPPRVAVSEAEAASLFACCALSAFCRTVLVSSSRLAEVSSRLAACSSVRCDRSVLPIAISREATVIAPQLSVIVATTPAIVSSMPLMPAQRSPISPVLPAIGMRWLRSFPSAAATIACVSPTARCKASVARTCSVMSVAYFTTRKARPF
nr:hypothetical protein [Roseomonas nepalensis]